jgi:predicted enzyme related to lactoylglutathione lyase
VDDPDAYLKKIEGQGGKTVVPTAEIPGMVVFAQFADPEGNVVGLVKAGYPPQT